MVEHWVETLHIVLHISTKHENCQVGGQTDVVEALYQIAAATLLLPLAFDTVNIDSDEYEKQSEMAVHLLNRK